MKRTIIRIDEEKCDGCGLCINACPEGALQLIDGKARLVSESYCDGLGACIGECPRGAITFETRDAEPFDEEAVAARMAGYTDDPAPEPEEAACPSGQCPGSKFLQFLAAEAGAGGNETGPGRDDAPGAPAENAQSADSAHAGAPPPSRLTHWPVQLHLVPVVAPIWQDADILIAADCTLAACPDFHERLLAGRRLIMACPKLDDTSPYVEKLTALFRENRVRSVTVAHMEVPCCSGLVMLVRKAVELSGKSIPVEMLCIDIRRGGVSASPFAESAGMRSSAVRP